MPGAKRNPPKDSCVFPFHTVTQGALAGGTAFSLVSPSTFMSPRALIEADAWAHFRLKALKFRLHSNDTITAMLSAGFVGGVQDTAPSSSSQISELIPSCFRGIQQTVPTDWVHVSQSELAGPLPWYKTVAGTADATEEAPGYICLGGSATSAYTIELRGVYEFKTSVATTNTPMEVELRRRIREERRRVADLAERTKILQVIATPPGKETGAKPV